MPDLPQDLQFPRRAVPSRHRAWISALLLLCLTMAVTLCAATLYGQETPSSPTDASESGDALQDPSSAEPQALPEVPPEAVAPAYVVRIDSAIHPVAAEFIETSLQRADAEGASVVVVELSTPGGLLTSTRDIAKTMLQARTPVVVYVSPSGAQAASAGFFVLMAGDIAAMAPGTNSGAAHPVAGNGEDIQGDMRQKVEEDSAALIRSLARQNGRSIEKAESAVLESRSFTAEEALEEGLIDLIAVDVPDLLRQIDGMEVEKIGEAPRLLRTAEATIQRQSMSKIQRLLGVLANPAIAALLMGLGGLGLYVEITNPGGIFPGVVGAICLIFGFYAMSVLPINYAGIALVSLGLLLFVVETQVPSFGMLTVGGSACLIFGAVLLFKDATPSFAGGLQAIVVGAMAMSLIMGLLAHRSWQVRRTPVTTGAEGLIGERGTVRTVFDGGAKVFVHGELWQADSSDSLEEGDSVEVVKLKGLRLTVRRS